MRRVLLVLSLLLGACGPVEPANDAGPEADATPGPEAGRDVVFVQDVDWCASAWCTSLGGHALCMPDQAACASYRAMHSEYSECYPIQGREAPCR